MAVKASVDLGVRHVAIREVGLDEVNDTSNSILTRWSTWYTGVQTPFSWAHVLLGHTLHLRICAKVVAE